MTVLVAIARLDLSIFNWCHARPRRLGPMMARAVSRTADGPLYVLAGLAMIGNELYQLAALLAAGFTLERVLYWLCKNTCKRGRPPAAIPGFKSLIEPSDRFSFPSGHTSGAFLMAWVGSLAYPGFSTLLYIWAASVAAARVMLGVHFPSDTVAGAALGTGTVAGVGGCGIDAWILS